MVSHDGFLISRELQHDKKGMNLILWVKTRLGPVKLIIEKEKPLFFITNKQVKKAIEVLTNQSLAFEWREVKLKDFAHQYVTAFYFTHWSDYQKACSKLAFYQIDTIESDIRPLERYLMERFICGGLTFIGEPKQQQGYIAYSRVKIKKALAVQCDLSYVSLDIECSEKGVLYSIGLVSENDKRVIMIGTHIPAIEDEKQINIQWVENEKALLLALINWFENYDPDLVIGWNVIDFDFKCLAQRAIVLGIPLNLGRDKKALYWRASQHTGKGYVYLSGRLVIDGIDGLKTATYSYPSWSLEYVANTLLGRGKILGIPKNKETAQHKIAEINRLYQMDKRKLAHYNLMDCQLVDDIFKKTQLIDFLVQRTRLTGIELDRIGGSVAAFTNLYLPRLHRKGYVAPTLNSAQWISSPGGYVMDSNPGLYDSVLVLDFKSLYPSIIRTFLIDPLGLIEGLKEPQSNLVVTGFKGGRFHKERHILPELITNLWQARDDAKQKGQKAFSQAIKIIMNSFYGVLGSAGCRFFDQRLASSITMRGHHIMKLTRERIEEKSYNVIYGDTDSLFVAVGKKVTNEEADEIGKGLTKMINKWWACHIYKNYRIHSFLELEYETHYQQFLMPKIRGQETGSKKRYAGLIERNGEKQLIFKGLESVRTDWTPLAQDFQQQLYQRIFNGESIESYIKEIVAQTLSGQRDAQLIYRKRLRRKLGDYQKNVPPHVKAARKADEINQGLGRPLLYQHGGWIEYLITVNGPEPAEACYSLIDYQHYVSKQLKPIADGILPFIDQCFDTITTQQASLF